MNKRQLADRIGNIDSCLVNQAGQVNTLQRKNRRIRSTLITIAAAVLMLASFTVGALAFSREVPLEQETIELPDIGLTLILPKHWKDLYTVEMDEDAAGCAVCVKAIHDAGGGLEGRLFWVGKSFPEPMTPEELEEASFVPCRYLFSTAEGTYALCFASDVQWDPDDPEQDRIYRQMQADSIEIQFVVDNLLADDSDHT